MYNLSVESAAKNYRARVYQRYLDVSAVELRGDPFAIDPCYGARIQQLLPADKQVRIVEIGCGVGRLVSFFRKQGYSNAMGVDLGPQVVRLAQERGLPVEQHDALQFLKQRPGSFDCIMAIDVLEHMFKDEILAVLDAAYAALRPGGCLITQTVNGDGLGGSRLRYIDITHEVTFTRYSLAQLFQTAGFSRYEFHPLEPFGRGFRAFLRKIGWKGVRLLGGLYYHIETGSGILRNEHILTAAMLGKAIKD